MLHTEPVQQTTPGEKKRLFKISQSDEKHWACRPELAYVRVPAHVITDAQLTCKSEVRGNKRFSQGILSIQQKQSRAKKGSSPCSHC